MMSSDAVPRVVATPVAADLIEKLKPEHGDMLFHESGGRCEGSAPMCVPASEFTVGNADVKLESLAGMPFYKSESQFEYWQHTQRIIDCVPGHGGMFPLERPAGLRFPTRSRFFGETGSA